MPPELENLLRQVQIDGTLSAKDFVTGLFFSEDSDYIKDFRNEFKNRFLEPFSRQLRNLKREDIKKIFDPLGVSDIPDDLTEDFKKYHKKIKDFLKLDLPEINEDSNKDKLKDTNISATVPERTRDLEPTTNIEEQGTFGPKQILVNLNDESKGFFVDLIKNMSYGWTKEEEASNKQMRDYYKKFIENQEEMIALSEGTGILGTLAKVLAIGGVGALLVSTFWESHIKPWMEETFDINLDFFDKFEGIVEGIGKFFTLGATGAAGFALKLQGQVLTSLADVLDNSITSVLKAVLGEGAESGGAKILSGGAKLFSGSFFARIAGNLFKGASVVALKGIPVIGALISFGFAIDRFQKSDYVGGVIDLVGGLVNLIPGPVGIALSLGVAGLNMFLDMKYGGTGDREKESKAKLGALGDMAKGLYGFLIKIPVIGGMIEGVTGLWNLLYSLAGGDTNGAKKALQQMTNFPLLGALPSILLAFLDVTGSPTEQGQPMNLPNFLQAFKKRVGQTVLSWFSWLPTSWQKSIAEFMGVPFDGTDEPVNTEQMRKSSLDKMRSLPEDAKYTEQGAQKLQTIREDTQESYNKALKEMQDNDTFYGKFLSDRYAQSEEQVKYLSEQLVAINERTQKYHELNPEYVKKELDGIKTSVQNNLEEMRMLREKDKEKEETVKVDDFYKPASGRPTLIFDQQNKTKFETAPNDDVFAMKPGGFFDTTFKEIKNIIMDVNKNVVYLNDTIHKLKPSQSNNITNISGGGESNENKDYMLDLSRDPVFNSRVNWWNLSERIKATIT